MASKRVLIVGGVAGGAACAARLRRLDEKAEIFIFEQGPDVSFANCGLPYYLGGTIPQRQQLLVVKPERFRDWFNVEVRVHREVLAIHRAQRTIEVRNVESGAQTTEPYDALVLSPGATPIRPAWPGIDLPGIFTLRNLDDTDRIQAWIDKRQPVRAVVVGGGYIGLEMVENLTRRGIEVTLLELGDQVMPPMDPEMVVPVHAELARRGVDLQLGDGVTGFEPAPNERLHVITQKGQRFGAALVILAIGVRPSVGLARDAGLEIGTRGGIRVDEQMRTSDPAIWAVGDAVEVRDFVTGQWGLAPLAGPAARQGRVAADAICGRDSKFRGAQGTAVVGVFDWTLAMTGPSEKRLRAAGIPYLKSYTHSPHHAGYYPGAEMMTIKLLFASGEEKGDRHLLPAGAGDEGRGTRDESSDPTYPSSLIPHPSSLIFRPGQILGAQAVGKAGVDKRIDVLAMAIQKGATVDDLAEAELCYAPQYGSAKDPVNMAGFVAGNILRGDVDVAHWEDWEGVRDEGWGMRSGLLAPRPSPLAPHPLPLVVDVRTRTEAAASAIPGSVNIPLGEIRIRLGELPRDREIWVHCGVGQRSYYASRILRQNGFRVRNLSGGMRSFQTRPTKDG